MPIVKRQTKQTFVVTNIRLKVELHNKLKDYAKFLEITPAEIVAQALDHAIKSDKEFSKFLAEKNNGTSHKATA